MEGEKRSNTEAFASATTTSDDDARAEEEIFRGIRDALNHEAKRRKVQLSPEMCDKLLEESFPKLHPEEDKAKELTMDEYVALETGLQEVIQSDVKEKMTRLRDQLSEYHSVLEDVMAFKSRCERLEQEKQDLVSLSRDACDVRDDKIALLEKELAWLRTDEQRRSSSISSCSSTDGPFSTIIGSGSELIRHDHTHEGYHLHIHPKEDYQHHPQQIPAPALTSRTPRLSDHYHHYYNNHAARMISLGPSSVSNSGSTSSSDGFSVGAIHPLLFQEPSAPMFLEMMNHLGVVDCYPY